MLKIQEGIYMERHKNLLLFFIFIGMLLLASAR